MLDVSRPPIAAADLLDELRAAMASPAQVPAAVEPPDRAELEAVVGAVRSAGAYAAVGSTLPPLTGWRGVLRYPARWAARAVLYCSRFLTEPQAQVNLVALEALRVLAARVDNLERHTAAPRRRHQPPQLEALHAAILERFRGSRDDIRERLRVYLPLLRQLPAGLGTLPGLDLGCGRGEWLELLRAEGWRGHGVDSNPTLVAQCHGLGLAACEDDVLRHLRGVAPDSVAVVTAFHVVEHLPFEALVDLVDQARRVLAPGGVLILETPDPENPRVSGFTFHLDPTHRRPWPSPLLRFVAEARGLTRVSLWPLRPPACGGDAGSVPQDYAIVAWKP